MIKFPNFGIGARIADGAIKRIQERMLTANKEDVQRFIDQVLVRYQDVPAVKEFLFVWEDIKAGYSGMTDAQRAALWTAFFIMLTKIMAS